MTRITQSIALVLLIGSLAQFISCASGIEVLEARINSDGQRPSQVVEIDPRVRVNSGVAVGSDGSIVFAVLPGSFEQSRYVLNRIDPSGVIHEIGVPGSTSSLLKLQRIPGSSTATLSDCNSLSDSDPIKVYEITPTNTLLDNSQQFWRNVPIGDLPNELTAECNASWVIADNASLYIIASNSLLHVQEGTIQVVIDDVKSAMGMREDCRIFSPQLAISDLGTISIFLEDNTCVDYEVNQNRPFVYIYKNGHLDLVQIDRIRRIEGAAFSPDEKLFITAWQTLAGQQAESELEGFKIQDGQVTDFLDSVPNQINYASLAFDISGDMFLLFKQDGAFVEEKAWVLKYDVMEK